MKFAVMCVHQTLQALFTAAKIAKLSLLYHGKYDEGDAHLGIS
jgi:hypothetical protein